VHPELGDWCRVELVDFPADSQRRLLDDRTEHVVNSTGDHRHFGLTIDRHRTFTTAAGYQLTTDSQSQASLMMPKPTERHAAAITFIVSLTEKLGKIHVLMSNSAQFQLH